MSSQRVISASCHCGAFNLSFDASELTLPEQNTYCHCTTCRQRTGQLAVFPLSLPSFKPSDEQRAALTAYKTHRGAIPFTTHFCSTCGATVFFDFEGFSLSPGLIQGGIDGLLQEVGHHWVGDTKDGGLADFMLPADSPRYTRGPGDASLFVHEEHGVDKNAHSPAALEHLPMHCDCGAFSVYISRPAPKLPLAKNVTWYKPPMAEGTGLPTRFVVTFCGCASCRTTSGSMIPAHPWVRIPFVDVHVKDEKTGEMKPFLGTIHPPEGAVAPESGVAFGSTIPGLTLYHSSAEKSRYHCSTCGATVLYLSSSLTWLGTWAAGLVDDPQGARAESWLSWWTGEEGHPVGAILNYDEAVAHDAAGAANLKSGLEAWGRKVGLRE